MQLISDTVFSQIEDISDEELSALLELFSFEDEDKCLLSNERKFYTGLIPYLQSNDFDLEIENKSVTQKIILKQSDVDANILKSRTLRDYQIRVVQKSIAICRGVIQAATGSGKTEMAAATIQHFRDMNLAQTALCLTPSIFLMQQMANKFELFGFKKVNRIGGNSRFRKSRQETSVFVVDSALRALNKSGPEKQFIESADMLILEEAHHTKSNSWIKIAEQCKAKIRLAYTATAYEDPKKLSYDDLVLFGLTGPIIANVRSKQLRQRGYLADPLVTFLKVKTGRLPVWSWTRVYKLGIVGNKVRNSIILQLATQIYQNNFKLMIFVGHLKHGHNLAEQISRNGIECVFVHGNKSAHIYRPSGSKESHKWNVEDIADYVNNRDRCILITSTVLDEGMDIPSVNVLIMATAMQKYRRSVQRVGRGMRPKENQNKVFIFDFWDTNHPFLAKHSRYRLWTYEQEEYDIAQSLDQTMQLMNCELNLSTTHQQF